MTAGGSPGRFFMKCFKTRDTSPIYEKNKGSVPGFNKAFFQGDSSKDFMRLAASC